VYRRRIARSPHPARVRGVPGADGDRGRADRSCARGEEGRTSRTAPVERDRRTAALDRTRVLVECDALPIRAKAVLVDRFKPDEHVLEADCLPELEDLSVPEQDVSTRFEIVLFPDPTTRNGFANVEPVPGVDERHVIDEEYPGLGDSFELVDHSFRADGPVTAAVEGPRTAERTIPRTAPAELDRRARIEDADEILSPVAYQIAGRPQIVKALHEFRRRSRRVFRHDPRHFAHRAAIVLDGQHELRHSRLAFAA
jgi:hypothetical protein